MSFFVSGQIVENIKYRSGVGAAARAALIRNLRAGSVMVLPHFAATFHRHPVAAETPSLAATWTALPPNKEEGCSVKYRILFAAAFAASLAVPVAAQAQGVPGGIAHGVYVGGQTAGPIGAVVGGAVGGVIGGVQGVLGIYPAAYPVEPEPVYRRHRHWQRHSYHSPRHGHTTG
jgi:hypothetical protein